MTQYLQSDIPCAVFNMLICLLCHGICLEKSTAVYFQPALPSLPLCRQCIDWLQIDSFLIKNQADCNVVYLNLTAQNKLWARFSQSILVLLTRFSTEYKVRDLMFGHDDHFRRAEVSVSVKVFCFFLPDSYHMVKDFYFGILITRQPVCCLPFDWVFLSHLTLSCSNTSYILFISQMKHSEAQFKYCNCIISALKKIFISL